MLFRRKSRTERMIDAARRLLPSRRAAFATAGLASTFAVMTAASSGVSALRQKMSG